MTWPVAVETATLLFGKGNDPSGSPQNASLEVHAVFGGGTQSVTWTGDDTPMLPLVVKAKADSGMIGAVSVPVVDQPGWVDDTQAPYTMWAYKIIERVGGVTRTKFVQPLMGQSTIDFDRIPSGIVGLPVSAPVVPVTSVNGQTGTVVIDVADVDLSGVATLVDGTLARAEVPDYLNRASQVVTLSSSPFGQRDYPTLRNIRDTPLLTLADQTATSLYWPQIVDRWEGNPAVPASERIMVIWSTDHATSYSNHAASGIWAMKGPVEALHGTAGWTQLGRIYHDTTSGTETETPSVHWNAAEGLWFMFYQQAGVAGTSAAQVTLLATSPDLLSWTRVGVVLDAPPTAIPGSSVHSGYFRPFKLGGRWYGWNIGGGSNSGTFCWTSRDMRTWQVIGTRNSKSPHMLVDVQGYSHDANWLIRWTTSDVLQFRGRTWLLSSAGPQTSGAQEPALRMITAPLAPTLERVTEKAVDITPPDQPWMTTAIDSSGFSTTIDGRTYKLFRANTKAGSLGIWEVV